MFRPGAGRARPRPLTPGTGGAANLQSRPPSTASGTSKQKAVSLAKRTARAPLHKATANVEFARRLAASSKDKSDGVLYFAALYTKRSRKKHKSFQDGFVCLRNDKVLTLLDEGGKQIAKSSSSNAMGGLKEGNTLEVNTYEVEVDRPVSADDFTSGRILMPAANACAQMGVVGLDASSARAKPTLAASTATSRAFRVPRTAGGIANASTLRISKSLHDPSSPNAVVLQQPYSYDSGRYTVAIVLDPYLSRHMRPHQKEGVRYLYECVAGANKRRGAPQGAVLGDEMGLGKSLQSLALIWTLLKQGPFGTPVAEKAIIVCPASLVGNWLAEIKKWLGDERLQPIHVISGQSKSYKGYEPIQDFVHGKVKRALVISYEMFRSYADELYKCRCGILVCDEGHRLKSSSGNKTIDALMRMPCRRRVILTGTPVQNNLGEFYAMCNFVNPGILGDFQRFRLVFASPVESSRDANADEETKNLGQERAAELQRVTSRFVLRRTSDTLQAYLPPKIETVVFCRLSSRQEKAYDERCTTFFAALCERRERMAPLPMINVLRKICCHPSMAPEPPGSADCLGDKAKARSLQLTNSDADTTYEDSTVLLDNRSVEVADSGKVQVALSLCSASVVAGDRVVLVSNFTKTLDVLQDCLNVRKFICMRLDGSTPSARRSDLVKAFNSGSNGTTVFLLSAKAGGVGLNLIGANRLILFDPDWNPATDLQTMARIWRDGQKKPVFVYRLLSTGSIEEKIYQRQLFKGELQFAVGESKPCKAAGTRSSATVLKARGQSNTNFTAEELKDLFTYCKDIPYCDTLQVLECSRRSKDEDAENVDCPAVSSSTLLKLFTQHRQDVESAQLKTASEGDVDLGHERFLPCGSDDVLSSALNGDATSRGIVSYLFSTYTGSNQLDLPELPADDECSSEADNAEVASNQDGRAQNMEREEIDLGDDEEVKPVTRAKASRKRHFRLAFSDEDDSESETSSHSKHLLFKTTTPVSAGEKESPAAGEKQDLARSTSLWTAALDDLDGDL